MAVVAGYRLGGPRPAVLVRTAAAAIPLVAAALAYWSRADPAASVCEGRPGRPTGHHGGEDEPGAQPVTILVPARDEAPVIARLIADLAAARRGPLQIVVIDDASRDGTGALATDAIRATGLADVARVLPLHVASGSKGAALAAVPPSLSGLAVVLDADARIAPDFLDHVRLAALRSPVTQARRRMLRPTPRAFPGRWPRFLADAQDREQLLDDVLARARLAIGGAAELRGDGMVLRAEALEALGGWPVDALCEDLELSSRSYLALGVGAARQPGLDVWEQPVLGMQPLLAQRLRWAEGAVRRDLRLVLPALVGAGVPPRRRVEVALSASQSLAPWAAAGLAARALRRDAAARAAAGRTLALLAAGYGLGAFVLGLEAGRTSPASEGRRPAPQSSAGRARRRLGASWPPQAAGARAKTAATDAGHALGLVAFEALWPLVLPPAWVRVALRPGRPAFVKTPHASAADFGTPFSVVRAAGETRSATGAGVAAVVSEPAAAPR